MTAGIFSIALLVLVTRSLAAQELSDTVTLKDIVITADRTPSDRDKVTAAITVISGSELRDRGISRITEALRNVPGAAVVSTGSFGGLTSLFLRGGESDHVKVLVDGVAVNQDGGGYDFGDLTTDNVDRIEIVRGPASVLYGSEAVTGVIQIFTRRGTGPARGEVSLRAGSYDTWNADASMTAGSDAARFSAGISRFTSDGVYPFNSQHRLTTGSASVRLLPDDRTSAALSLRLGDGTLHVPTDGSGSVTDSNAFSLRNTLAAGLDLTRVLRSDLSLNLVLNSYGETDDSDNRPDSPGDSTGFFQNLSQMSFHRRSAEGRLMYQGSVLWVTLGTIAEFEDVRESSQSAFNFGGGASSSSAEFNASRRNLGVYTQVIGDLTAGTRVSLGTRLDDNEGFGTHLTYRIGAVQQLRPGTRIRGSAGSGFKEPSLRENFALSPFEVGNPSLKPEHSRGWEVGAEHAIVADRAILSVTLFDQRFRDLIQYLSPASPGDVTYFNVTRASSRGVEASLNVRPVRNATLDLSYTWLDTRVDEVGAVTQKGDVFREGERLIRRPEHSFRLDARYRLGPAALGAALTHVGQRDDVDFRPFPQTRVELAGYTMLDVDASVTLTPGAGFLEVSPMLRVENALDQDYETVVGFPGRPRTVLAGARVRF